MGGFGREGISRDEIRGIARMVSAGLLVALMVFVVVSTVYKIEADSEGVVLRFGKEVGRVTPGLHMKLPWPIDHVYEVPVQRIHILEFGFETQRPGRITQYAPTSAQDLEVAEMLTGDMNLAHVEWIVQYRVKDPQEYLFSLGGEASDETLPSGSDYDINPSVPDTIADVSESVMRKLVGDRSIDSVLTIGRDQIGIDAKEMIQAELDEFEAGVVIDTVKLQSTSPPTDQVQDAFQEVNRSRQTKEKVVNEALGERNSKIPAARGAKDQAIAEAEGYQDRVVLETTGETSAFLAKLAEYNVAPDVTQRRLYLEAMEEILGQVGQTTIIDESVHGVLPVLNLDDGPPIDATLKGTKGGVR